MDIITISTMTVPWKLPPIPHDDVPVPDWIMKAVVERILFAIDYMYIWEWPDYDRL